MTRREILTYFTLTALTAPVCQATVRSPDDDAFTQVIRDIALHHIAPGYKNFATSTQKIHHRLSSFINDETDTASLKIAFQDVMDAWMAVQHLRFGPSLVATRAYRIQFWPDSRNRVGRQLSAVLKKSRGDLVNDSSVMAKSSVALQGLPALERLLYEVELTPGNYASQLAHSIAANLQTIGKAMAADWVPGSEWFEGLISPNQSPKSYPTVGQAASTLLLAMTTQLEFMIDKKIKAPLGQTSDNPRLRLAESWRSGRSLRNLRLNIVALIALFEQGDGRFRRLLENTQNSDIAESISSALHSGLSTVEQLPDDYGNLLSEKNSKPR